MCSFLAGLLMAVATLALPAQGAMISSSSCTATNVPPNGSTTCTGLGSAVGFTNLTIELNYALDVTYDPFNPPGSATFALDSPLLPWDLSGLVVNDVNRPLNGSTGQIAISVVDYVANFQSNFNVAVSAVFAGTATNANANMQFRLYGDRVPDQDVPEPYTAALAFIGLSLIAIGRLRSNRNNQA